MELQREVWLRNLHHVEILEQLHVKWTLVPKLSGKFCMSFPYTHTTSKLHHVVTSASTSPCVHGAFTRDCILNSQNSHVWEIKNWYQCVGRYCLLDLSTSSVKTWSFTHFSIDVRCVMGRVYQKIEPELWTVRMITILWRKQKQIVKLSIANKCLWKTIKFVSLLLLSNALNGEKSDVQSK